MASFLDKIGTGELWTKVKEIVSAAQQAAVSAITAQKNQPNGIAGLDSSGKLQQMPTVDDIGTSAIFLASHPIGSLFETTVATNPGTLYGGTWAAWGGGRTPVGVNTADTDFSTVEKTGGEKTHTLTVEEIPSHNHPTFPIGGWGEGSLGGGYFRADQNNPSQWWQSPDTSYTGGGQAHNNLQPYITCYIWKRTT